MVMCCGWKHGGAGVVCAELRLPGFPSGEARQSHERDEALPRHPEKATTPKINRDSFNRSFGGKNATAYGKGCILLWMPAIPLTTPICALTTKATGTCASNSSRNSSRCRRLLSRQRHDACPAAGRNFKSLLYDSTVNRLNRPSMHVQYHDAQAYPEYLITRGS
jgi:hypothetical protein